ncbi:MAG: hypothetical protein D3916_13165 [Candidatus Electrothrix sp. MAN1_4]|nr:hypothetical protein [Candidatus Electrothrix sp. MAN1_4]
MRRNGEAVLHSSAYRSLLNGEDELFWEQHSETYVRNRSSVEHVRRMKIWLDGGFLFANGALWIFSGQAVPKALIGVHES